MKKVIPIILVIFFASALIAQEFDVTVAKRTLSQEQSIALKYQEQAVANRAIIRELTNAEKYTDFKKRIADVKRQKYVAQFEFNKQTTSIERKEELADQIDTFVQQHEDVVKEFETFVNSMDTNINR
jgi:Flp pilus assembly protein TadG